VFKGGDTGCRVFFGHLANPNVCRILAVAAKEAPELLGDVMIVTEGFRPHRTGQPSLHPELRAFDLRTGIDAPTLRGAIVHHSRTHRLELAQLWADRMRLRLGTDYDVVFGDDRHIDHIHVEYDP
jgi:hypothetical protein